MCCYLIKRTTKLIVSGAAFSQQIYLLIISDAYGKPVPNQIVMTALTIHNKK
jgi:hypothetical protein